ncbi:hypothetical protein Q5Z23_35635, partial [Pseudomonas aeruginosa]|uniref:hypothetical protein n=1 Tax=Pseudomonas aeruginosa TaxID=287 RepID=UPI0027125F92
RRLVEQIRNIPSACFVWGTFLSRGGRRPNVKRDFRVEIGIFAGGMLAILTPTSGLPSRPFIDFSLRRRLLLQEAAFFVGFR